MGDKGGYLNIESNLIIVFVRDGLSFVIDNYAWCLRQAKDRSYCTKEKKKPLEVGVDFCLFCEPSKRDKIPIPFVVEATSS
jgi:hypothetical protein